MRRALRARRRADASSRADAAAGRDARATSKGATTRSRRSTDKLDARDPSVVALKARAAIARGRYPRPKRCCGRSRSARRRARRRSSSGCCSRCSARPTPPRCSSRSRRSPDSQRRSGRSSRAAARALRALGRFQEANAAYRDAAAAAPDDAGDQHRRGASCSSRSTTTAEALKSFQAALQVDPTLGAGARSARRARSPTTIRRRRSRSRSRRSRSTRRRSTRTSSSPARRSTPASTTRRAKSLAEGARRQPVEPRRARAARRRSRTSRTSTREFEAEVAKALAIAPRYGEVYRVAGELAAHNYRFDEAVDARRAAALALDPRQRARARPISASHLLRTGDEPGARAALERVVQARSVTTSSPTTCSTMMDTLDKFVTVRDGDLDRAHAARTRRRCCRSTRCRSRTRRSTTLSARYEFTPKGPILDRDLSEARRLRRAQRSACPA